MSDAKENPCPDCGEMVRINSLRCWNCGAFMDSAVEAKYMEMQSKPQQTIYSQLPDDEVSTLSPSESTSESGEDDEFDDFEISMPTSRPVVSGEDAAEPAEIPSPDAAKTSSTSPESRGQAAPEASGDDLLNIALQDERRLEKQRRKRSQRGGMKTPGGGLIIFCPYGCRMVVKESHRGMQGKCPECQAPFVVPVDPPNYRKEKSTADASAATESKLYSNWLEDLHLHAVNPEKLKLKADSLLKEFVPADFIITADGLLVVTYGKKSGGLFGGAGGKDNPRDTLKAELQAGKKFDDLSVPEKYHFSKQDLDQLKVVQPAQSRTSSIFHGITVFGEGRIAIQLPNVDDKPEILYVSLGITRFWELKQALEEAHGLTDLGAGTGIPDEPVYTTHRCHFMETPIRALQNVEFFKVDESVELETVGYQCGKCQTTVSEAGREREKLGGKSPKGIAKAKCPKCGNKMGENLLYGLKEQSSELSTTTDA